MIVIGLTGSIAMGKSTASALLETMGIQVHDSDAAVHDIYKSDQSFKSDVRVHFPEAYIKRSNSISRQILGDIVFQFPEKKKLLESLLHPKVRAHQQQFLKKCRRLRQDIAVLDIPLLFETGSEVRCDYVIVVSAPAHTQRARALRRPGMTLEKFKGVLASQMPDSEKRAQADFVINSGLGRRQMLQDLHSALAQICRAYTAKARG